MYKGLLCKNCIKDLHTKLIPYGSLLHADNDAFVAAIDAYIGGNKQHALEDFVGHCCIINQHFEKKPTATHKSEQSKQPAPFRSKIAAQPTRRSGPASKIEECSIGGCMCLPEFNLLIPTNFNSMDILGLGHEREPGIKGKWHFVIDETFAAGVAARGVYPQHKSLPPDWIEDEHRLQIRLPHELLESSSKKQVRNFDVVTTTRMRLRYACDCDTIRISPLSQSQYIVQVFYVPQKSKESHQLKGSNKIDDDAICNSF